MDTSKLRHPTLRDILNLLDGRVKGVLLCNAGFNKCLQRVQLVSTDYQRGVTIREFRCENCKDRIGKSSPHSEFTLYDGHEFSEVFSLYIFEVPAEPVYRLVEVTEGRNRFTMSVEVSAEEQAAYFLRGVGN